MSGHMIRSCGHSYWLQIGRRVMDANLHPSRHAQSRPNSGTTNQEARAPNLQNLQEKIRISLWVRMLVTKTLHSRKKEKKKTHTHTHTHG